MPKASPLQSDFSGGEVSEFFQGRVDSDYYPRCVKTLLNYIPTSQGGATRRPGTQFIAEVKDSTKNTKLVSFRYSTDQAYVLEFGDEYLRIYRDQAQVLETAVNITGITQANPAVVTAVAHGYSTGQEVYLSAIGGMTTLNGRNFKITVLSANTFSLQYMDGTNVNSTAFTAYTSGGTTERVYTAVSPYDEADVFDLRFTQSADVLYITHPDYAPRKLSRTSDTAWTFTTITFLDGPYLPLNTTATTLTPSAATGTGVTITASAIAGINNDTGFQTTDVGRIIRMREGSTWGYVRITARASTTSVTVDVINTLTNTNAKVNFRMGLWSETTGYPSSVVFHEDRLVFAGTADFPQRVDGSKTGDYENMAPTATDGTVASDNAISFSLNANEVNASRWLTSDEKGLLTGTTGAEWVVRPSTQAEALSPTNVTAKKATSFGGSTVNTLQVGKATLFVQRSGRKMREFVYFYDVDGFQSNDLTYLANHILESGVVEMAYQSEPQPIVWCVRTDGVLAGVTYARDPDNLKVGWARYVLGGVSDAADNPAIAQSVAVIPSPDESFDQLWVIVKRRINGRTVKYIETLAQLFGQTTDQKDAVFVDSSLTYDVPLTITNITQANPAVITSNSHGLSNGDTVVISDVEGMTELNTNIYTVANVAANTFQLSGVNSTAFTAYVSAGEARKRVMTVSGLWHLEGQSLSILGDGAVQPNKTVTNGAVTLATAAAVVQLGLGYNSDLELLRMEAGSADGTALGKTRRTHRVGFLLHRTLGLKIGTSFDDLTELTFRTSSDLMGHAPELFSGIKSETFPSNYDFENNICIRQDQPLPGTILAVAPQLVTQDR